MEGFAACFADLEDPRDDNADKCMRKSNRECKGRPPLYPHCIDRFEDHCPSFLSSVWLSLAKMVIIYSQDCPFPSLLSL